VSELGSGSGKKTRYILQALSKDEPVTYYPIEISPTALALCERELSDINHINVVGTEGEYLNGLLEVAAQRPRNYHLLLLFLGSTIGNFDRGADLRFLQRVREILNVGDALLLGTDLLKPTKQLLSAYDDALGVTAAFNLNLLARINRELDADFQLEWFKHQARFNRETSSVEMHLSSRRFQTVTIAGAELTVELGEGETIWTETSHKYSLAELHTLARNSGFRMEPQWMDREWLFAESLFIAV
jgi:dimethylhistidine N-methyltransferase